MERETRIYVDADVIIRNRETTEETDMTQQQTTAYEIAHKFMSLTTHQQIKEQMQSAAYEAAHTFITQHMGGEDRGACGFAWVTLWPEHKGNTRKGKAERREFEALGASKDWTGKAWMIWNPAGYPVQNIDTLEAGARAAADVLKAHGYKATAGSRLD